MRRSIFIGIIASVCILASACQSGPHKASSANEVSLVGTKWKLVELAGQVVVTKPGSNEYCYLQLTSDGKFSAFAGCNRILGKYDQNEESSIRLTTTATTRMACVNMKTEQVFREELKLVHNFVIKKAILTLNSADEVQLARFEAVLESN